MDGPFGRTLPRSVLHALERAGIRTRAQLRSASDEQLLDIRGIGPKNLELIHQALASTERRTDALLAAGDAHAIRDAAMVLRWTKGESFVEIGRRFGISASRAGEIITRARRRAAKEAKEREMHGQRRRHAR